MSLTCLAHHLYTTSFFQVLLVEKVHSYREKPEAKDRKPKSTLQVKAFGIFVPLIFYNISLTKSIYGDKVSP